MAWNLDTDRPIYAQLVERIQMQIVSGYYPPGGKLPSVRELAAVAAVSTNTMQKACAELESNGLIITQRTNGRTVTEDTELIKGIRRSLAKEYVDLYFSQMKNLGYLRREAVEMIEERKTEEGEEG